MMVARAYSYDAGKTAKHLDIPLFQVNAAFTFATDFSEEIDAELAEFDAVDFESLKKLLPNIRRTIVPHDYEIPPEEPRSA
jgi:hypothetical protein